MMARYSRAETLFGISSSPVHHSRVSLNLDDENEFKEEDVWDMDARGWLEEESTQESHHIAGYGSGGGGGHVNHRTTDSSESFRFFNNGRRWLGLETDPGLSVAFADGGRTLGLSSLSPLKPANSTGHGNCMGTTGREVITTTTTTATPPARIATSASRMMPPTPGAYQLRETNSCAASRHQMMHHQSASVNVPDWTKILGSEKKSVAWADEYAAEQDKDDDDDGEHEERLPPHELLAREYANSQATTFSVFEGAGRTLKGRDLSRVRNAVLRKTGFIDF